MESDKESELPARDVKFGEVEVENDAQLFAEGKERGWVDVEWK